MPEDQLDTVDDAAQKKSPEERLQYLKSWMGRVKAELKGSPHHQKKRKK